MPGSGAGPKVPLYSPRVLPPSVRPGLVDVPPQIVVRPPDLETVGASSEYGWRSAPDPHNLAREHSDFCDAIRAAGGEVLEGTTPVPGDPDAIYVRDPVLMTSRGVVLLHLGTNLRRGEPAAVARDTQRLGVPVVATMEPPATAEGGDMFFLDATALLVGRSFRTNEAGIANLRALRPEVEVVAFDLPHLNGESEVLHLMSLISPLDEGLAVGYLPLLPVRQAQLLASSRSGRRFWTSCACGVTSASETWVAAAGRCCCWQPTGCHGATRSPSVSMWTSRLGD
jgi:N-dimethylarginine dimethylaminohydrolase